MTAVTIGPYSSRRGVLVSALSEQWIRDTTREELLQADFSIQSVPRLYNEEHL
jgi:hypothetical protein